MGDKEVREAMRHRDKQGNGAKKRKKLRDPNDKVHAVMGEFKRGTLHSGIGKAGKKGPLVETRAQAQATAMSEAGLSKGQKVRLIIFV